MSLKHILNLFCVDILYCFKRRFMNKKDLEKLVGEELGDWEIMNVDYSFSTKQLDLLLQEFEWKGCMFSRDYKQYLGKIKKLTLYDEFAFKYCEDGITYNAVEEYVKSNNGLNIEHIKLLTQSPYKIFTTCTQLEWLHMLKGLNLFDEARYSQKFLEELKKYLKLYLKQNDFQEPFKNLIALFEDFVCESCNKKID